MATLRYTNLAIFRRLLSQARPYWLNLTGILLLSLLATPLALLTPVPLKIAVDSVIGSDPLPAFLDVIVPDSLTGSPFRLLLLAACLQVVIVLVIRLQDLSSYVLSTRTGEGLILAFRARLFRHVQRLSLAFHDSRGTADSLYRIQYDAPSIQSVLLDGIVTVISSALMVVAMISVTARISLELAVAALAVCPFVFILGHGYDRRMRGRYIEVKELESRALKVVHEVLTAVRIVKAFGREHSEEERFVHRSSEGARARVRLAFAEGVIVLAANLGTAAGTAVVLFIGIRNVLSGIMSLGEVLMVLAYLSQLYGPLEMITGRFAHLQSSLASARRAFELLDQVLEVTERPDARSLRRARGAIEFRNVSFAYEQSNEVLRDVAFAIPPGARLGIAGSTGVGKTTLVNLLLRFYDPTSGQILLDGADLRMYKLEDLRNQFAVVQQEPVLFSTSIAENIAYGRPGARAEAIVEAAELAGAHDFVARLPRGYETQVGERGMTLSGGERQRIALARAFLKDAPILILDEPTSAVDIRTEAAIIEAMERLIHGRTTLIIAHRLSTLGNCDAILVMREGQVVALRSDVSAAIRELTAAGQEAIFPGRQTGA